MQPVRAKPDLLQKLVSLGCDAEVQDGEGDTCLHTAARGGFLALCKWLVEEGGADKSVKNAQGQTAAEVELPGSGVASALSDA